MSSPKAKLVINKEAANKADEAFHTFLKENPGLAKITKGGKLDLVDPMHYTLRKQWMDFYEQSGGRTQLLHVCARQRAVRILPVEVEATLTKKIDAIFSERHPELKGQPLAQDAPKNPKEREHWSALRNEWLDIFESIGGETVVIAGLETGTPVRIPKV
jgi:hypothetical protein